MGDQDFDELVSKQRIQELYQIYARGADRFDASLLATVYHDDAIEDHAFFVGPAAGFIETLMEQKAMHAVSHHHIAPALIEIEGDTAYAEAYFLVYQLNISEDPPTDETFGGRYVDRLERRDGVWKFAYRRMVLDYSRASPSQPWGSPELRAQLSLLEGRQDEDDEVYSRKTKVSPCDTETCEIDEGASDD